MVVDKDLFEDDIEQAQSGIHNFSTPGEHFVSLVVIDENGMESEPRTLGIRVLNPKPIISVKIFDVWYQDELVTATTPLPEGATFRNSHTFDDDGNVVTTPGQMLYFDSTGTKDGDRIYENRFVPELNSSNWNGIVEYSWDFGDATPISHEPMPWHSFDRPGTYKVYFFRCGW